ncbi:MAG TPA: class II aldolase/adducin family protein [Solirubrobacteraceae bacterium]|nr:class II aldolase/adducin family protein [Solirubrobacteraceae bacterium]
MSQTLREEVALGCRVLEGEGQGDLVWGHVSARDPLGRGIWMKASSFGFGEVGADQVILVSFDGEVLEGDYPRHAEYPIHTELMRARADVGCVVHTHAPWSVAFASTQAPLRPLSHEPTLFVPPDVARFTLTGDLILTRELGEALAATVGERNAALMVHHGIVACGKDVPSAVMAAVLLERACRANIRSLAGGGPATWSSDEEALAKRDHCYGPAQLRSAWEFLVRSL